MVSHPNDTSRKNLSVHVAITSPYSMMLNIRSDVSYLSESKARSRVCGHCFTPNNAGHPENNGAVLNVAKIIKHAVTPAAYANTPAISVRHLLE